MTDLPLLDNAHSDRVRSVRALGRRTVRSRQGRFLVEGPQAVRELLGHRPDLAQTVYATPEVLPLWASLVTATRTVGVVVRAVSEPVLCAMADTPHPQGVLAVARTVDRPLQEVLGALPVDAVVVVLTNVRDPGNAGTVIRGASAFGAAAVLVSDASVDVHHPKVVRSSVGCLFHVPVSIGTPVPGLLGACREAGLRLLAADGTGEVALPAAHLDGPHAWVLGNEAWGLEETTRAFCDDVVAVPIMRAESLNLAMAATVCLHASASARRSGPPGAGGRPRTDPGAPGH